MKHEEINRKLSLYLENDLGAEDKEEVKRHLSRCGLCREALIDLEWTVDQLRSLPEIDPPEWLTMNIMAQLQEVSEPMASSRPRRFPLRRATLSVTAAALLFLCIFGYYLFRSGKSEVSGTAPAPAPAPAASPARPAVASPEAGKLTGTHGFSPVAPPLVSPPLGGSPADAAPRAAEEQSPPPSAPPPEASPPVRPHPERMAAPELPSSADGFRMEGQLGPPPTREGKGISLPERE